MSYRRSTRSPALIGKVGSEEWRVAEGEDSAVAPGEPVSASVPGQVSVTNIVGMVPTKNGKGYWLAGSDGGVFSFGDANPAN